MNLTWSVQCQTPENFSQLCRIRKIPGLKHFLGVLFAQLKGKFNEDSYSPYNMYHRLVAFSSIPDS